MSSELGDLDVAGAVLLEAGVSFWIAHAGSSLLGISASRIESEFAGAVASGVWLAAGLASGLS